MYVYIHIYICACTQIYMYIHINKCTYECNVCAHIYACVYSYIYTYIHLCAYLYASGPSSPSVGVNDHCSANRDIYDFPNLVGCRHAVVEGVYEGLTL